MKKLAFIVLLVFVGSTFLFAQSPPFNQMWKIDDVAAYTASTANDTIPQPTSTGVATWLTFSSSDVGRRSVASEIRFFAQSNDSLRAVVFYQLRNSEIGASSVTAWANYDTAYHVDDLASATYDTTTTLHCDAGGTGIQTYAGHLASTILLGYDQIRFYVDYIAGSTDNKDGTASRVRYYIYLKKNENSR